MTLPTRRPAGVTLLVVLIVIGGLLGILGGVLLILVRNDADAEQSTSTTADVLLYAGIGAIVLGLLYLLVSKGLANGNGFSRFLVAFVSVLDVIGGLYAVITGAGQFRVQGVVQLAFGLVVLALLYSRAANAFFRSH